MVAITTGLKVNWSQVLFQVLTAMVNNHTRQSQGFAVQLSVLLEFLVKADLGESFKLHPQKVLTNKSVHTYIKKYLGVGQAGETSKASGPTTSEQHSTADEPQALPKEPKKVAVENPKKKKQKFVQEGKKQKMAVQQPVEAGSQAAPTESMSETSSYTDLRPLAGLKKSHGAKQKHVVESSDSEATEFVPQLGVIRSQPLVNQKPLRRWLQKVETQADKTSNFDEQQNRMESETQMDQEGQDDNAFTIAQVEHEKYTADDEAGAGNQEKFIESIKQSQQSQTYTGKNAKGKGVLPYLDRPNPVEEHAGHPRHSRKIRVPTSNLRSLAQVLHWLQVEQHSIYEVGGRIVGATVDLNPAPGEQRKNLKLEPGNSQYTYTIIKTFIECSEEHTEPLGSLGLNGAGDDPVDELVPTGGDDLCAPVAAVPLTVFMIQFCHVATDKVSELLHRRDLIWYKLVELHLREAIAKHWKNFHKDKPSVNQDIMGIRMLEAELEDTRKRAKPTHSTPDERMDRELEHQNPKSTADGHIEEVDRTVEDV
ncbi:phycocyanobilin ferredoxin oxidoreductase-like protein [Dorcoceras hygrometricum]|uniref:Phycocyanobilin ferredoxin oxidoreductase-like protein n=1 Tax=Dorcoceras hygrometricum TaxID=472368 RepID=A0A2Z7CK45_9LAMI|nr:phycocyanobilin ferredoxin oxidoreductase-like protein [Dorcoceras hygrometricum]